MIIWLRHIAHRLNVGKFHPRIAAWIYISREPLSPADICRGQDIVNRLGVHLFILFVFTFRVFAQTATTATPTFPAVTLPAGVAVFASFNQLGSPRWTGGVVAIYPTVGSVGIYGTTTAEVIPKLATDPTTHRKFYAISSNIRQGFHKDLLDTGRWKFMLGGDVGPSFTQAEPSGISVSLSSSFVVTPVYQASQVLSLIAPVRMLYVSGIGWNPVVELGAVINVSKLPKAK